MGASIKCLYGVDDLTDCFVIGKQLIQGQLAYSARKPEAGNSTIQSLTSAILANSA
jgi:hypothetical protein